VGANRNTCRTQAWGSGKCRSSRSFREERLDGYTCKSFGGVFGTTERIRVKVVLKPKATRLDVRLKPVFYEQTWIQIDTRGIPVNLVAGSASPD
jgi:hypothetical protein